MLARHRHNAERAIPAAVDRLQARLSQRVLVALAVILSGAATAPARADWCASMSCPACAAHGYRSSGSQCFPTQSACRDAVTQAKATMGASATYTACTEQGGSAPPVGGGSDALSGKFLALLNQARLNEQQEEQRSAQIRAASDATNRSQLQSIEGDEQQRLQTVDASVAEAARRRQALIAQLSGATAPGTEFGVSHGDATTMTLKPGTSFFGVPANPSGTMTVGGEGAGLSIAVPDAPPAPPGVAVPPSHEQLIAAEYDQAASELAAARQRLEALQTQKIDADRAHEEAEERYHALQGQPPAPSADSPTASPEDDQLAQAKKLLSEATELDESASLDLTKAQNDVKQATLEVDRADKARAQSQNAATPSSAPQ